MKEQLYTDSDGESVQADAQTQQSGLVYRWVRFLVMLCLFALGLLLFSFGIMAIDHLCDESLSGLMHIAYGIATVAFVAIGCFTVYCGLRIFETPLSLDTALSALMTVLSSFALIASVMSLLFRNCGAC